MQHCKFCGSELPARARFCGNCGRTLYNIDDRATEISDTPTRDLPPSESAARTFLIKPVRLQPLNDASENQYSGAPERYPWSVADNEQLSTLADNQQNDEDEWQRRGMILGAPLLTMLAEDAQAPAGNVPMVQGTPQASGIPMVQGTPPAPANPPAGQLFVQNPAPSAPSTTPNAGSWMPHTPPPQHGTDEFTGHHQTHTPARHHVSGELAHHHVSGELPTGPLHASHHRARFRMRHLHGPHGLISILIVTTIAIVVIVTSGIGIGLAILHPSLSLSGSSSVVSGGTMSLHGRNFIPGSSVTLTLDNGLPLPYAGHGVTGQASSYAAGPATASQLSTTLVQATPTNASVPVNGTGSFDITIHVSESWSPGKHTIHAIDSVLGRSTELQFTVLPKQGVLELLPSTLDFGKLQKGTKAILSVVLSNTGQHPLTWKAALANAASTNWLKVQPVGGTTEPGAEQFIYLLADTSSLKVGSYSAMLAISSDAGTAQVPINLQVIQPGKPQAQLVANPQKLDFGQLVVGKQSTLPVTIGNVGTRALNWKATTGNASWLTLDSNNGTVNPGGLPHAIQVTANATGLAAGNYSATLSITSNGGSAQVTITVTVLRVQVSGQNIAATAGVQFNGQVATVSDPAATSPGQLSATIDWGDGSSTSAGTISGTGPFTVSGSHTYATAGSFTITITVTDATTSQSGSGTAIVAAPPVKVSGQSIKATAGIQFSGQVATVSDAAATNPSQLSATIDWGDKTGSTPGTVSKPNGTFTVTSIHTYSSAGGFTITITVTDATTRQTGTGTGTATVSMQGPTVTVIDPNSGPAAGGTRVTITGSNFTGATSVSFGKTAATSFKVNSDTQITAVSPASSGTVDVIVTTPGGTSATSVADQFSCISLPTVTAISPNSGPAAGGTSVTITGSNFTGATSVSFGKTAATSFKVNGDTQITAVSPAGSGTVDVTVTTLGGTSATSSVDQLSYIPSPTVTGINPAKGQTTGSTRVTITGSNFTGATSVSFGKTAATSFKVNSDTQITAVSPAGSGTVDVTITTPGGTSATSTADQFSYYLPIP